MRVSRTFAAALTVVIAGTPVAAAAHTEGLDASATRIPLIVLAVLAVWLYARGLRRLGPRWPRRRVAATVAGGATAALALLSPLDTLATSSVAAHMSQHTLLTLAAAPLLALGRPLAVIGTALPHARWTGRLLGTPRPGLACGAHALALWLWHLPPLYDMALARPWLHALAHATLVGTAMALWWSVTRGRPRMAGALWLFVTTINAGVLGALLALSARPWFADASLEDQQLGGLVMWVPAGVLLTAMALALLAGGLRAGTAGPVRRGLGVALAALMTASVLSACNGAAPTATMMAAGDSSRGREALRTYGCTTCHTIPGVPGHAGSVGPPLTQLARRAYVAGAPNDPDHLVRFIAHPRQERPGTPMPELGVSDHDARDIAAYLYTLR